MSSVIYIGDQHHKKVFSVHATTLAKITGEDACCCLYDPNTKHLEAFFSDLQIKGWGEEQVGVTVQVQRVYLPGKPLLAVAFQNEDREYFFYFIGKRLSDILVLARKYRLNGDEEHILMDSIIEEYLLCPPPSDPL